MGTIKSEQTMRRLFNEKDYGNFFEFIGRDEKKPKFLAKCKRCGNVHSYWAADVLYIAKHMVCHYCGAATDGNDIKSRSALIDATMAYYAQGHSASETAEKFGFSKFDIYNFAKLQGVSNKEESRKRCIKKRRVDAERRLADELTQKGFQYVSGYTDNNGSAKIKCVRCGNETERSVGHIKRGNLTCPVCEHEKTLIRQAKRKEEHAEELKQKAINREQSRKRAEAKKADALFYLLNDKTHTCTVCGKSFSIADYMKDCGLIQIQHNPRYCSGACKRKATNRKSKECKKRSGNFDRGNHRHRARKHGVPYESGITLKKVWKRNNGICQICGKPCDWSDRSWNEYCGPLYPSIDHVVAMANGGWHVWSNVQLAHMMCNSEKGDKEEVFCGEKNI